MASARPAGDVTPPAGGRRHHRRDGVCRRSHLRRALQPGHRRRRDAPRQAAGRRLGQVLAAARDWCWVERRDGGAELHLVAGFARPGQNAISRSGARAAAMLLVVESAVAAFTLCSWSWTWRPTGTRPTNSLYGLAMGEKGAGAAGAIAVGSISGGATEPRCRTRRLRARDVRVERPRFTSSPVSPAVPPPGLVPADAAARAAG